MEKQRKCRVCGCTDYKIMISVRQDRGSHKEAKSVPFRIDKILRLERLNGSK